MSTFTMKYGQYRGVELEDVPLQYLAYIYREAAATAQHVSDELVRRGVMSTEEADKIHLQNFKDHNQNY